MISQLNQRLRERCILPHQVRKRTNYINTQLDRDSVLTFAVRLVLVDMPLKRTPPATAASCAHSACDSESDLNSAQATVARKNSQTKKSTRNTKRKHEQVSGDDGSPTKSEMKLMFNDLKEDQNTKMKQLLDSIQDVKSQNADLQKSMEYMSQKYDDLLKRLDFLEGVRKSDNDYTKVLENKIESLERQLRSTTIEIRNIPMKQPETKQDLLNTVEKVGEVLNVVLQQSDINNVYRINAKSENKPIIVQLHNTALKEKIINCAKRHNKSQKDRLTTTLLNIEGPSKQVYISENLTQGAKMLFYKAREFAKVNDYSFCWTAHGRIFLRKREGAPQHRIDKEEDLRQVLKK